MARLRDKYYQEIIPALIKEFSYKNFMAVPKIKKVVINVGVGEAIRDGRILDSVAEELGIITGQKPVIRRAKKAIAAFKLRQGMAIGLTVTLRRRRMYEFLDRFLNIALPRVRDFRGVPNRSFDGQGNYTVGVSDQLIFPEIDLGKTVQMRGMNVTIVTTARTDEEAGFFLTRMGVPFVNRDRWQ